MELLLIGIFIIINAVIVIQYYHKELGVFQAPFIMACISLGVILPQFTSIYFLHQYPNRLMTMLGIVMITSNLAFTIGFELGKKLNKPKKFVHIDLDKFKYVILLFALAGLASLQQYAKGVYTGDMVIASNLKTLSSISFILSLIAILQGYKNKIFYFIIVISILPSIYYAFFVKASREESLFLFISFLFFIALKHKQHRTKISRLLLVVLLLGSVLSANISLIRRSMRGEVHTVVDSAMLWDTFTASFKNEYSEVGMDLGNAALGIDYCHQNSSYDYGMEIWNGFVFFYVPRRLVGEEFKQSIQYDVSYTHIIESLTHGITTMTGYFGAFSSFSVFGFILFLIVGFFYGAFWSLSTYSNFYLMIYFLTLVKVGLIFTHSFQYFFAVIEIIFIFLYPVFFFYMRRGRLTAKRKQLKYNAA